MMRQKIVRMAAGNRSVRILRFACGHPYELSTLKGIADHHRHTQKCGKSADKTSFAVQVPVFKPHGVMAGQNARQPT